VATTALESPSQERLDGHGLRAPSLIRAFILFESPQIHTGVVVGVSINYRNYSFSIQDFREAGERGRPSGQLFQSNLKIT